MSTTCISRLRSLEGLTALLAVLGAALALSAGLPAPAHAARCFGEIYTQKEPGESRAGGKACIRQLDWGEHTIGYRLAACDIRRDGLRVVAKVWVGDGSEFYTELHDARGARARGCVKKTLRMPRGWAERGRALYSVCLKRGRRGRDRLCTPARRVPLSRPI